MLKESREQETNKNNSEDYSVYVSFSTALKEHQQDSNSEIAPICSDPSVLTASVSVSCGTAVYTRSERILGEICNDTLMLNVLFTIGRIRQSIQK